MKLHVVFNKDGEILGAVKLGGDSPIRVRPIVDQKIGHREAEVYVPAEYHHYDLTTICQRMKVNVEGKFPNLTMKE